MATSTLREDFLGRDLVTPTSASKDFLSRVTTSTVDSMGRALRRNVRANSTAVTQGQEIQFTGGTKYVVKESVDEVLLEIREYRARILATSYEMDRGEYRPAVADEDPSAVSAVSSVVPFPSREER